MKSDSKPGAPASAYLQPQPQPQPQRQPLPQPQISLTRSSSVASNSSAAQRLQWRNHEPIFTPNLETGEINPFDYYQSQNDEAVVEDDDDEEEGASTASTASDESTRRAKKSRERGGEGEVLSIMRSTTDGNGVVETGEGTGRGGGGGILNSTTRTTTLSEKDKGNAVARSKNLSWRERIRHFTWTWFTMTMATGGLANVLYTVPYRFPSIYALGCIFFILNIILFIFNITMISLRFYWFPKTFKASFLHPTESLFIPAAVISFGTILINISQYGVGRTGPWLEKTMSVLYWCDCGLAIVFSIGIYLIMWSTQTFTISQMTPVWIFPAYPLLIIGPHAGNLAPKLSNPHTALLVILSGFIIQGIGFLVSLMIYAAFIYRLMTQKLPKESLRPGMFISVGPSGFTIAAMINMGQTLPKILSQPAFADFMGEGLGPLVGNVGMICANFVGLWLWGLALWFFLVSVGAHWSCATRGKMDFAMTWYSFVFPNTALTTATFAVARALDGNRVIRILGCVLTVGIVLLWAFVFAMMVRAVVLKQILWPQKQEDRTEGGFKQQSAEEQRRRRWDEGEEGAAEDGLSRVWSLRKSLSVRRGGEATGEMRKRGWSMRRNTGRTD